MQPSSTVTGSINTTRSKCSKHSLLTQDHRYKVSAYSYSFSVTHELWDTSLAAIIKLNMTIPLPFSYDR